MEEPAPAGVEGGGADAEPDAPAGGEEGEVKAEVSATIDWEREPFSLAQMMSAAPYATTRGGVYVVARLDRRIPVYVGISDDLRTRWSTRLALFGELGMSGLLDQPPFSAFKVYIGRVQPQLYSRTLARKDLLETVERVLIRYLVQDRGFQLTNRRSSRAFVVQGRGITVVNSDSRPWFLPPAITRGAGQTLEVAPELAFAPAPFPAARTWSVGRE